MITREEFLLKKRVKECRARMQPGWSYSLDDLINVDILSDKEAKDLIKALNEHWALISEPGCRWSMK